MSYESFCYCWKIEPTTGSNLHYTTNNNAISFLGETYIPTGAIPYTIIQKSLGLSTDNLEFSGAFTDDITFEDLRNKRFVDARVSGYRVNTANTSDYTTEFVGRLGQFAYDDFQFRAEVRSLSSVLSSSVGRVYSRNCPHVLGDSKCQVSLSTFSTSNTVISVSGRTIGLGVTPFDNYYTFGTVVSPSGAIQDIRFQVGATVELWESPAFGVGDTITLRAGCDKVRQTCKDKFSNIINFGGFDLIPSEDILTNVAVTGTSVYNGGSYFEPLT